MANTLSELLHEKLDERGAAPRTQQPLIDDGTESNPAALDEGQPLEAEEEPLGLNTGAETLQPGEEEGLDTEAAQAAQGEEGTNGEAAEKYNVTEFANAIGWEAGDLYNDLTIPFANGESKTLGELKDGWEQVQAQQAEVQKAREELQQQQQALQSQQQALFAGQQQQSEEVENARGEVKSIEAQYSNVDWDKLENEDPGRAANLRQKFATAYAQAQDSVKKAEEAFAGKQQEAYQQYRMQNLQQLIQRVPEWQKPEVYQKDMADMSQYLFKTYGFTNDEMGAVSDWRHFDLIRKAYLYEQLKDKVDSATQRVRQAPKQVIRPGRPQPVSQINERRTRELEARARQTGRSDDRMAAARAIVQSSAQKRQRQR